MGADEIRMTIPALVAYVRLPRVAVAGLATRSGFSVDEVEDLRLAVGEACHVLLGGADGEGTLAIRFAVSRGQLEVVVGLDGAPGEARPDQVAMAERLLAHAVGRVTRGEDGRSLRFAKTALDD